MNWVQTFTIIGTIIGSMIAAIYVFYNLIKEDIKRHDAEFMETRKLWASILEKISKTEEKILRVEEKSYKIEQEIKEIKLFHSLQLPKK